MRLHSLKPARPASCAPAVALCLGAALSAAAPPAHAAPADWGGGPGWADAGWIAALAALVLLALTVAAAVAAVARAKRRSRAAVEQVMRGRESLVGAYADLARTNARLADANEQLERFTNVAAHDLRAPLRALMTLPGWVREELSDAGVVLPPGVSGLLDDIFDQAACMDRMLKDLLDYARLGGPAERTRFAPGPRIAGMAQMAGLTDAFVLDVAADIPELELNTVEFDVVMRNLLSNAVRHHDRACGRIAVRGRRDGQTVVIEVEDDGPGIAPEHRERVFEIFSTLGGSGTGGGMGLAFVRRLAQGWGGAVTIHAPAGGRGAVFRLLVPAPDAAAGERREAA